MVATLLVACTPGSDNGWVSNKERSELHEWCAVHSDEGFLCGNGADNWQQHVNRYQRGERCYRLEFRSLWTGDYTDRSGRTDEAKWETSSAKCFVRE
jgi:hypothetical protein